MKTTIVAKDGDGVERTIEITGRTFAGEDDIRDHVAAIMVGFEFLRIADEEEAEEAEE